MPKPTETVAISGLNMTSTLENAVNQNRIRRAPRVHSVTAAYSVALSDGVVLADATGGAYSVTLPAAGSAANMEFIVKKIDASANAITVAATSGNIDGSASASLSNQWDALHVVSDGTDWLKVSVAGSGSGDIVGPGSATDNAITRFDGTTGKLVQNSGILVNDSAQLEWPSISSTKVGAAAASQVTTITIPDPLASTDTFALLGATQTLSQKAYDHSTSHVFKISAATEATIAANQFVMNGTNEITFDWSAANELRVLGESDELRFKFDGLGASEDAQLILYDDDGSTANIKIDGSEGLQFPAVSGTPAIKPAVSSFNFMFNTVAEIKFAIGKITFIDGASDITMDWLSASSLVTKVGASQELEVSDEGLIYDSATIIDDRGAWNSKFTGYLRYTNVVTTSGSTTVTFDKGLSGMAAYGVEKFYLANLTLYRAVYNVT